MFKPATVTEQVTSYLRDAIAKECWTCDMPGRDQLAKKLNVHGSTIERALKTLEKEGLVESRGPGKPRKILKLAKEQKSLVGKRISIILYEQEDRHNPYIVEIRHRLARSGNFVEFFPNTLEQLNFDPERLEVMIAKSAADALIVASAPTQILKYLSETSLPVFALFGSIKGLPIAGAGPDTVQSVKESVRWLVQNGHQRIVHLSRTDHLKSSPNKAHIAFYDELQKSGLPFSKYNLPNWESSPDGFQLCLHNLFKITPPTALMFDDWILLYAARDFLASCPKKSAMKVTCVCLDYHPCMKWSKPRIPHFTWDYTQIVRRIQKWSHNILLGKEDTRQTFLKSHFSEKSVEG